MQDPYEVLGVSRDASAEEIRRVYREQIRRHHPDRHAGASEVDLAALHRRAAEITAAYRMLNDPAELERFRRLRGETAPGAGTARASEGGGVRFTAGKPRTPDGASTGPGETGFDYRTRAPSEFDLRPSSPDPRRRRRRWGRRRRRS